VPCDEIGIIGRIDAFLTATTLMRSWGLTHWSFWQNVAQVQIYGSQANTLVDNAGVIPAFGAKNMRMAQDFVNLVGVFRRNRFWACTLRNKYCLSTVNAPAASRPLIQ
jgi:type IV secretory pathway TraG/TraD family ATPase VirD4